MIGFAISILSLIHGLHQDILLSTYLYSLGRIRYAPTLIKT